MLVWRLTRRVHASLDGQGARIFGGRWNSPGRPLCYLTAEASLTVLEVRVHLDLPFHLLPEDYVLMAVDLPDLAVEDGPAISDETKCRAFGDRWLAEARAPLLRVPSVIVPESSNVLLNPAHPAAAAILPDLSPILRPFQFDARLFP